MKYKLIIGWLYPSLMSTYGDRGNMIVIQKRCEWRNIDIDIIPIEQNTNVQSLKTIDLIFGGGAQDREQEIVMRDLHGDKGKVIQELVEKNVPALFVCGSPQLMGKYYEPGEGQQIEGLGIFDMVSRHPGPHHPRLIGNVVAKVYSENFSSPLTLNASPLIVGFENHGGRTYLGPQAKPFAKIIKGNGNNGEDGTEGVVYKNAIGCYFHGPLLPKNPEIADWLMQTALERKYNHEIPLQELDDSLENKARTAIAKRLGVTV